ncbi:MAG: pilus assembly protein PilM [Gammaproteobacteria bacterium]|nr:pilus assembly protein PilM [Gammaproteobacteria bacterium]
MIKRKKQAILGIDISSTTVKLLELSFNGSRYRVESYAVDPLPPNAVVEMNINDIDAVGESIAHAVKRSGTKATLVAVAVAGSSVITKIITMPAALSDREMEMQIELEADQYIPYPIEEVSIDFEVQGPTADDPESVDVLLAASRSENVDMRAAVVESAELIAKIVDIEAYAMENAFSLIAEHFPDRGKGMTIAMVDVGATMTTLNVLHDNKIVYTRDQVFGGKQLTEEIMRRYGMSYEEAGMAKRQGGLPETYEEEVLNPFKKALAQQVSRSLQFFYSSTNYNSVDRIVLAGGGVSLPGIQELVQDTIEIETIIANPFSNMTLAPKVNAQALAKDAPAMMIACGLALRGTR